MIDINYIKNTIQVVLDQNHTNSQKKKIKIAPTISNPERLNFACPICGDSDKSAHKKRGNLYIKTLRYKCFNCGDSHTYLSFLKRFGHEIDPDKKLEIIDYIDEVINTTKWSDDEFVTNNLDKLIPIEELTDYFNNNEKSKITDFRPVAKGSKVYNYLVHERKIYNHEDIYEATYWHTNNWSDVVLINMNQAQGKVLGMQLRNLKSGKVKRFYKIISFSELYLWVKGEELDDIEKKGYDKLSHLFNILKVDWSEKITFFEGFLDTKFFPNSVGMVGTNTDINFLLNQEGLDFRFFYDYDKDGIKMAKYMLKKNKPVFLWELLFEDLSTKSKNVYSAYRKLVANIVDLNDLGKFIKNPYHTLEMEKYFSKDEIDIMHIKDVKDVNLV